jgi:hypothetical protein
MRTLTLAVAIFLVSAAPVLAQPAAEAWANKLFMNKTAHDFGTVARGAQLKYSFPIKNIYAVPLEITLIRPSCGCVTAKASKNVLQPQEEGSLDITMDGSRFTGPKSVTVQVSVGPEYVSTATLKISANARSDVVFNPGEFNFGVVQQGQQPQQTVDVEYAGSLDFRISEVVKPAEAPFSVTIQELYRNQPNGKQPGRVGYRLTLKLNADAPGGAFKYDLALKTNDQASEVMSVTVDGNVQAALRAAPNLVNLGAIKVSEARNFKVQVLGNRPFKITEVQTDGKEIKAEVPQTALMVHTLSLTCIASNPGELKRQLTIVTDLDKNARVTVSVQASVAQ